MIDFPLAPSTVEVLPSIFLAANATGQFTTLWSLIESVGLGAQLNTPGPLTVFAPTDDAFAKIPNLEEIAMDPQMVLAILTNHVVGGFNDAASLTDGQTLTALSGGALTVSMDMGSVMINDATVTQADIIGSNGVVHAIGTLLVDVPMDPGHSLICSFSGFSPLYVLFCPCRNIDTVLIPSMGTPPGPDVPTAAPVDGETEAPTTPIAGAFGVRGIASAAVALLVAALL